MYTVRWMPFDSDSWYSVLVGSIGVVDYLVSMLEDDDGIRKLQVIKPDTSISLDREWVQYGRHKNVGQA